MRRTWLTSVLVFLVVAAGCEPTNPTADDVEREIEILPGSVENNESDIEDFQLQREQFVAQMREGLAELDKEMELASARAGEITEDAREEWEVQKDELAVRRNRLQRQFEELSQSTAENWEELEHSFQQAYEELRDEIEQFTERMPEPQSDTPPGVLE